ncbi:hypothetical protein [Nesterenkonia flava]|uniref:Holin n=1 Tax=Nesterenkonia flava TaxID=469799 RepID=A0ABU1FRZ0_9MICC|nr:hypothetical protein [Nesterenkonia flava]MDR5711383.1 hypothetical protein [Nesterenkonia flava]
MTEQEYLGNDKPKKHVVEGSDELKRNPGPSTQEVHPWKATLRTVVATVIGLVTSGLLTLLAEIAVEATTGTDFASSTEAFLAFSVATTGAVTRIMANPLVNAWLIHIGLGTGVELEASYKQKQARLARDTGH